MVVVVRLHGMKHMHSLLSEQGETQQLPGSPAVSATMSTMVKLLVTIHRPGPLLPSGRMRSLVLVTCFLATLATPLRVLSAGLRALPSPPSIPQMPTPTLVESSRMSVVLNKRVEETLVGFSTWAPLRTVLNAGRPG